MSLRSACAFASVAAVLATFSVSGAVAAAPSSHRENCTGAWPAYWQDPAFNGTTMWQGQKISDTPESQHWKPGQPGYTNPPFALSDNYAHGKPDDPKTQTWRDKKFDPMFDPKTPQDVKLALAEEYSWDVMHYIQDGNIDSGNINTDWNLCANKKRHWYNMPFQTYNVLQGREFIHGLTREAPVSYSVKSQPTTLGTTVWAVGFYNGNAAPTLAQVWHANGTVTMPAKNLAFGEATVIGKLLFTTATPANMSFLTNMPEWKANLSMGAPGSSNPTYCTPPSGASMPQQSEYCQRSPGTVRLLQFDIGIRDNRATNGWVFGTFVADGIQKKSETNPWNRISLLGLMWGNDAPPYGTLASQFPVDPMTNGFKDGVVAWDVAARLNEDGGSVVSAQPGHLGCDKRLNGPADNVNSSCLSCHMTASVPDSQKRTPPIMAQFGSNTNGQPLTAQCAAPGAPPSGEYSGVTYAEMDSIYFAETKCGTPFNTKLKNGVCVLGTDIPDYKDKNPEWVSTDFSLQMSGALVEWKEWKGDLTADNETQSSVKLKPMLMTAPGGKKLTLQHKPRVFKAVVPERGE